MVRCRTKGRAGYNRQRLPKAEGKKLCNMETESTLKPSLLHRLGHRCQGQVFPSPSPFDMLRAITQQVGRW